MMVWGRKTLLIVPWVYLCLVHGAQSFTIQPFRMNLGTHRTALSSVVDRLDLSENFNRWKYLQNLLDEELEAQDVNEVLYVLIYNYKNQVGFDPDDSTAPERTSELLEVVDSLLQQYDGSIPVLKDPDCIPGNTDVLSVVEKLLPDPLDKEEAFKGAWDTVLELHGRTSVGFNEGQGRPAWKTVFMVARVMIYFEFLTGEGLLSAPQKRC
jgi:hypothetical protein